ncbi:hypothetical protein HYW20_03830 [Candidatus Woesearchaeota archaeon]|nr:hypothetical protein [Candidatus Woesearchaeota archaeon]
MLGKLTKEGKWKNIVDRDVALWATFENYMSHYECTQDASYLQRAKDALSLLFQNLEGGKYNKVMFTVHKDDAAVGGYSTQTGHFIKSMPIEDAHQAYRDAKFTSENFSRDQFYLAPVRFQPLEYDGLALIVTQLVPGPDIGEIFRVLNSEINSGSNNAERIKSMILEKNLEDLILWQEHFHKTVPEEIAQVQKRPDIIISRYKSNVQEAVGNAQKLTYAQPNLSFVISDLENELINLGAQIFDSLSLADERIARIRDDAETNSGLELGVIRFKSEKDLYEAIIRAVSKPAPNGNSHRKEMLTPDGYIISHDRVNESYAHWDTATGKFGHYLEDFFHIVNSYSLGLSEFDKSTKYRQFLLMKFGNRAEFEDIGLDRQLIQFFRSFRKRDLIMTRYARNNEQMYRYGARNEVVRNSKRADYAEKAKHYITISHSALDKAIDGLSQLTHYPEAEILSTHSQSIVTLTSILGYGHNLLNLQKEIDKHVKEIKAVAGNTSHDEIRKLGQLYALAHISKKMSFFNNLYFDKLL